MVKKYFVHLKINEYTIFVEHVEKKKIHLTRLALTLLT